MGDFEPQELVKISWAFSAAGISEPELYEAVARVLPEKMSEFTPQNLSQMHQVYMFLRLGLPEERELTSLLGESKAELLAAFLADEPSPSRSQRDVIFATAQCEAVRRRLLSEIKSSAAKDEYSSQKMPEL